MAEGWPEEQRPDIYDPDAAPGDSFNELLDKVAGMATERTYSAVVGGSDTHEVAREIIGQAGILSALGFATRAAEGLNMFEALNVPETSENAKIYANYRKTRVAMMLKGGLHYSDEAIRSVVDEQEASPFHTPEISSELYYRLALQGDAASFRKWFEPTVDSMLASQEQTSEHNPFPEYGPHTELAKLLVDHVFAVNPDSGAYTSATPFEAKGLLMVFMDVIKDKFAKTERKALLADRMHNYLNPLKRASDRDVWEAANELEFVLLEHGVESKADRNEAHITDCRMHKRLIMSVVGLTERRGKRQDSAQELLDKWKETGLLKYHDLVKIERWREETRNRNQPRKRRRR